MRNSGPLLVVATLTFSIGVADSPAIAQSAARSRIAAASSMTCLFPLYTTGTWVENTPQAEIKTAKLTIQFDSIDTQDGTADAKGGSGAAHVVVRLSGGHLHFLQIGSEGPVYVTTVFDQETAAGKLKAVHTRHEYTRVSLPGYTSRPEQYYGECEVQP